MYGDIHNLDILGACFRVCLGANRDPPQPWTLYILLYAHMIYERPQTQTYKTSVSICNANT